MQMMYVGEAPAQVQPGTAVVVTLDGSALEGVVEGVEWSCSNLVGWWDATGTTGQVAQRSYQSGGWIDRAFSEPRTLVVSGLLRAPTRVDARLATESLMRLMSVDTLVPLVVTEDGLSRYVMARQEGKPVVEWVTDTLVSWNIQLVAPDWRRFSGTGPTPTYSQTVGLPRTQGGRVRPYTLPARISATVVSGSVDVTNVGSAPAPVVVRFDGPVSSPTVRMPDGQWMSFALDVLPGQELTVDFDARTVLLNGVSRRGVVRGRWLVFGPGVSTLIFDAGSFDEAARMTVSWSDSWK